MIGLAFLGVAILWLALTIYLTIKIPRWLGLVNRTSWLLRLLLVPLMLVGPFIDEIVGMRQFEELCKERAVVKVSSNAAEVLRATRKRDGNLPMLELPGYWIKIQSQREGFIDVDTGKTFLSYEILHTRGGRIVGMALMGGEHSCSPPIPNAMNSLDIDKLLKQGKQP